MDTTTQSRKIEITKDLWREREKKTISTFMVLVTCPHTGTNTCAAVTSWYMQQQQQKQTLETAHFKAKEQSHPHIYKVLRMMDEHKLTQGQIYMKCTVFLG